MVQNETGGQDKMKKLIDTIIEKLSVEQIDLLCGLTERDYNDYRRHCLEQCLDSAPLYDIAVKLVEGVQKQEKKLPTLPFMTEIGSNYYMYYTDCGCIRCLNMGKGEVLPGHWETVEGVVNNLIRNERVVEVDLVVK